MKRVACLLLACANLVLVTAAGGIYPDKHWDYSTKLTTDTFDDAIKAHVDSGKTFMVRWIASEG